MPGKTAREIDVEAAKWAARVDAGPLPPGRERALDDWLAADPRCPGAFARMRALALASERARALGADFDPADFMTPSRRRVWQVVGAAGAALAVAGHWLMGAIRTARTGMTRKTPR